MRPSRMPTSPAYHGEPVPSMMCPCRITTSNDSPRDSCRAAAPRITRAASTSNATQMAAEITRPRFHEDRRNTVHLRTEARILKQSRGPEKKTLRVLRYLLRPICGPVLAFGVPETRSCRVEFRPGPRYYRCVPTCLTC